MPEIIFTVLDIIPLQIFPRPYVGLNFKESTAASIARSPSSGQGVWKVKVKEGRSFSEWNIFSSVSAKVELMSCTARRKLEAAEVVSTNILYKEHKAVVSSASGAVQHMEMRGGAAGDNPIVKNPGCVLETDSKALDNTPEWNEWLVFANSPMFEWEASRNENIKISIVDNNGGSWFSSELMGETIFNAVGTVGGTVQTKTIVVAGGEVDIEVKWELVGEGDKSVSVKEFSSETAIGCWRVEGEENCRRLEQETRRRLEDSCAVGDYVATCQCEGINAHINTGFDFQIGVGEIDLPFEFSYESGMSWNDKRLFAGVLQDFTIVEQEDLVCLDCEGCLEALNDRTAENDMIYSVKTILLPDGSSVEQGWIEDTSWGFWTWGVIIVLILLFSMGSLLLLAHKKGHKKGLFGVSNKKKTTMPMTKLKSKKGGGGGGGKPSGAVFV